MEVIPNQTFDRRRTEGILHVCGGDPKVRPGVYINVKVFSTYVEVILSLETQENYDKLYSPRMWRWSYTGHYEGKKFVVFSTYVEVILTTIVPYPFCHCILHVCGGDPCTLMLKTPHRMYSPRMWRWSPVFDILVSKYRVFSTYVEVIPNHLFQLCNKVCILHVCGGDPI